MTARAWAAAVQRERLPQSAKRYAAWLAARPDRKNPGLFLAGQVVAATALGLSDRTVREAERTLINIGALRRERRGVRQTMHSRMTLLPAPFNRQKLPVESGSQPELGGRLKSGSQPEEISATNVLRSDTSAVVLKPTGHRRVFITAVAPTEPANARLENGGRGFRFTDEPQLASPLNPPRNSTTVVIPQALAQLSWKWRARRSVAA